MPTTTSTTPFHAGETVRRGFLAGLGSAGPGAILLALFVLPSVALLITRGMGSGYMLEVPTDVATALLGRHLLLRMGGDRESLASALRNGARDLFRGLPAIVVSSLLQLALMGLLVLGLVWMGGSLLTVGAGAIFAPEGHGAHDAATGAGMATGGLALTMAAGAGLLATKALFFTLVPIVVLERVTVLSAFARSVRLLRQRFTVILGVFAALAAVDTVTVMFEQLVPLLSPAGVFLRALVHSGAVVATWVSLREANREGDLFDFVREVGGTPHGEQGHLEAQRTAWATAQLAALDANGVPSYREPAPISVADDALMKGALARELRLVRVRAAVFAAVGALLLLGAALAIASRVGAARERRSTLSALAASGSEANTDTAVARAISLYGEELYGMKSGDDGDVGSSIRGLLRDDERSINVLRKDLLEMGCSDAAQTALHRRSATQFMKTCNEAQAARQKFAGEPEHLNDLSPSLHAEPKLANAIVAAVLFHRAEKRHTADDNMHAAIERALLR